MNNKHISFPKESRGIGIPNLVNFTPVDLKEETDKTITSKCKILLFTVLISVVLKIKRVKKKPGMLPNYFEKLSVQ